MSTQKQQRLATGPRSASRRSAPDLQQLSDDELRARALVGTSLTAIRSRPVASLTPEQHELVKRYDAERKRKTRAKSAPTRTGELQRVRRVADTMPPTPRGPVVPADSLSGHLLTLLRQHGTREVLERLEGSIRLWADTESSARIREQLYHEAALMARLVGSLDIETAKRA